MNNDKEADKNKSARDCYRRTAEHFPNIEMEEEKPEANDLLMTKKVKTTHNLKTSQRVFMFDNSCMNQ
jgi:hypothetical protein